MPSCGISSTVIVSLMGIATGTSSPLSTSSLRLSKKSSNATELMCLNNIVLFPHDGHSQTAARAMAGWACRSMYLVWGEFVPDESRCIICTGTGSIVNYSGWDKNFVPYSTLNGTGPYSVWSCDKPCHLLDANILICSVILPTLKKSHSFSIEIYKYQLSFYLITSTVTAVVGKYSNACNSAVQ